MNTIHVIGICGKGMSAVAIMLKQAGWRVTGSDAGVFDPVASYLKQHDQDFFASHDPSNIPIDVDIIMIGKHAKLTPETNEEVAQAFAMQAAGDVKIMSFPEVLSQFLTNTNNYVVVGSYGKSTCTALITHVLKQSGRDPSYFIGAFPKQYDMNAYRGGGNEFVLEGDEYPSANFDTHSKFLWYQPSHILFTSGEHDHVNVFPTQEAYLAPYQELFTLLPSEGKVIACSDNPHTTSIAPAGHVTYGVSSTEADYGVQDITYGETTSFTVTHKGRDLGICKTSLLGEFNVQNILGVIAFLLETTDLSFNEITQSIASFTGVKRRLDRLNISSNTPVFEAYGSSYAKAKAAIEAIQLHFPNQPLVIVFEPHTFSWRNPNMTDWYHDVFAGAEEVHVVMPPAAHGKEVSGQLAPEKIEELVAQGEHPPKVIQTYNSGDECFQAITAVDRDNHVFLLITSGDLQGLSKQIPEHYK